jgi:hypothetical protein
MSQPQDQVTHRLVTFIQSIQLRRGSGLLSAKRGQGASAEEGSITFINGQVTEAKVGRYTGSEAFNRLSTWENCQFSFVLQRSSQEEHLNRVHTDALESLPSTAELDVLPKTQPLPSALEGSRKNPETPQYFTPFASTQGHLDLSGTGVPRPGRRLSAALQMIELMGLSRTHLRLFLLIDGKRSIDQLAPLIGRTPNEVSELLHDLERASVILMPNVSY